MSHWIKEEYYHPILWEYVDTEKAKKYSIKAVQVLEDIISDLHFFQYQKLVTSLKILGQIESLNKIESIVPTIDKGKFKRRVSDGEIAILNIDELKSRIPKLHINSIELLVRRLLDESQIEASLKLLKAGSIKLRDYIPALCYSKLDLHNVTKVLQELRKKNEFSIRHFCIRVGRDILSSAIDLSDGLLLINEFQPLTDLERSVFCSWLSESGNYETIKRLFKKFDSKDEYKYSAISLARKASSLNNDELRTLCTSLLNNTKKDNEVKLYISLMNEICVPTLKLNDTLLSFVKKYKRHQPDDEIFYFLLREKRIKDAKLFVDVIQGVNKKHHYGALVKELLDKPKVLEELFEEKRYNTISEQAVKQYAEIHQLDNSKYWLKKKIKDSQLRSVLWRYIIKSLIIQGKFNEIDEIINNQRSKKYKYDLLQFTTGYLIGENQLV